MRAGLRIAVRRGGRGELRMRERLFDEIEGEESMNSTVTVEESDESSPCSAKATRPRRPLVVLAYAYSKMTQARRISHGRIMHLSLRHSPSSEHSQHQYHPQGSSQ